MADGMTCYERDETFCEDQMCLRTGCRIRNKRLTIIKPGNELAEFAIVVMADHPNISFDLMLRGVPYTIRMHGGEWQLLQDGAATSLARGSMHWTEVLRRAIETIEKESQS